MSRMPDQEIDKKGSGLTLQEAARCLRKNRSLAMRRPSSRRYLTLADSMQMVSLDDFFAEDWMVEPAKICSPDEQRRALSDLREEAQVGLVRAKEALVAANWDAGMAIHYLKTGSIV